MHSANPAESMGMVDPRDIRGVPVSGGIPPLVRVAFFVGIVVIFAVGAMVIATSDAGHMWPASSTLTIPLTPGS